MLLLSVTCTRLFPSLLVSLSSSPPSCSESYFLFFFFPSFFKIIAVPFSSSTSILKCFQGFRFQLEIHFCAHCKKFTCIDPQVWHCCTCGSWGYFSIKVLNLLAFPYLYNYLCLLLMESCMQWCVGGTSILKPSIFFHKPLWKKVFSLYKPEVRICNT